MASGPSEHGDQVTEALPASYTAVLLLWSVPFLIVVLLLVVFYGSVLIFSVSGFLSELNHPSSNNGPLFFSLVGMITGAYLLAIIIKALTSVRVPEGIRMPPGAFPQLDKLIRDCTEQAGIEAPDDVFIVPDANAFAYSSGRFSLHERLNHYVLIGAPLLAMLEPPDLAAVLFHEFGHLILRRDLWAVSLHHKVEDFLTRCLRGQLHRQGCALFFTLVPGMAVALFLRAFRWSLAGFSKREELLVDSIAGRLMGEWQFRDRLVRSIATIGALTVRVDGERALVEQINAEFHRRLMAAGSTAKPSYFEVARSLPAQSAFRWEDRLDNVYQELIRKQSGPTDSHPSLAERIRSLHGTVGAALPFYPSSPVHLFSIPRNAEAVVSSGFGSDVRAVFFKEKLAAGRGLLEGISPESVVEFHCRYGACPRHGQIEVGMTHNELYLSAAETQYRLQWHEIRSVEIYTGGNFNFFMAAARVLGAAFREAPSDRVLRVTLVNGGMIEFPHWHVLDNIVEVEALVKEFWGLPRVFGVVTEESSKPIAGAFVRLHDQHGAVCAASSTEEDGSYSLTLTGTAEGRLAVSARAEGFVDAFTSYGGGQRFRADLVLHGQQAREGNAAAKLQTRHSGPPLAAVPRLPTSGNPGVSGCLASVLKLGCAAVGYFLPFAIAVMMTLSSKDYRGFGDSMSVCAVIGFCTGAIGWRLGNRLAVKYLFTKRGKRL
jgi:Zn-dependent protease with chaperone function